MLKRFFDIVLSGIGLVVFSPLLFILSLLIICDSKGGVLFRGIRIGQYGKPFKIFKFRSMLPDCEGKGKWNVGDNDNRITKIGHVLRKTKLDELPQLINVFIGNMSLVGPRPELQYYVEMYNEDEKKILEMKPGITDWASITNISQYIVFSDTMRDPDKVYLEDIRPIKLKLQLYYYEHRSLGEDFKILFLTIFKVVTRSRYLPASVLAVTCGKATGSSN